METKVMETTVKDIQFEGFVFSGINEKTNDVAYFLQHPKDSARRLFIERPIFVTNEERSVKTQEKPDVVTIVRYFRRYNNHFDQIESSGGVTALCVLDYDRMKMYVYPAFCSDEDNFNKMKGLSVAESSKASQIGIVFDFSRDQKIEHNIYDAIVSGNYTYTTSSMRDQLMLKRNFEKAIKWDRHISPAIAKAEQF